MNIQAIKTRKVSPQDRGLLEFLDRYVPRPKERSVLAITSKVVAILEGAVEPMVDARGEKTDKKKLIAREADRWLPASGKYDITLTIKNGILAATAGIDESNGQGFYILWPRDPQGTANYLRRYLMRKFRLRQLGVIITDSSTRPLRRGTFGIAIAHSGFRGLNNYIGSKDIFGRKMKMTKANIMEALATAAVLMMGEGAEQKPLAVIENAPLVKFQKGNPSRAELADLKIGLRKDLYAPLMKGARWRRGRSGGRGGGGKT
jgi:putative folate metabolism gamma-glutamate ligase